MERYERSYEREIDQFIYQVSSLLLSSSTTSNQNENENEMKRRSDHDFSSTTINPCPISKVNKNKLLMRLLMKI